MDAAEIPKAVAAAIAVARAAELDADEGTVIYASNRIAVRLQPADVLARVAFDRHAAEAAYEVEVARHLGAAASPIGTLDPRVEPRAMLHDGFVVSLWTYYEPLPVEVAPPEFAAALVRLHAGMRQVDMASPHFTYRVGEAHALLDDPARTPELDDGDRAELSAALRETTAAIMRRGVAEQLIHGEPHEGNLLNTSEGPRFIDLATAVRGPVEFDVAHAPDGTSAHYPDVDEDLVEECRILMLAMITTWRWDRDDRLPNGRALAAEWLEELRIARSARGA